MGLFGISDDKEQALQERWQRLGLREEDVEENFIRSSGPGGQNVNKVSTCVQLRHRPTGLEVKCQQSRSQTLNRYYARQILADKLERQVLGRQSAAQQHIEKIRRQKRKRSKRAKEKMLDQKHKHSEKKASRKSPASGGD